MPAKPGVKSKLTNADRVRIREMIEQGSSDAQIAAIFNVSRPTINRLRHFLASAPVVDDLDPLNAMILRNEERRKLLIEIGRTFSLCHCRGYVGHDTACKQSAIADELWVKASALSKS